VPSTRLAGHFAVSVNVTTLLKVSVFDTVVVAGVGAGVGAAVVVVEVVAADPLVWHEVIATSNTVTKINIMVFFIFPS